MASHIKSLMVASAAALLAACATATPYQPAAKVGAYGFDQQQIESNRFSVSFSGNSLTERETVETYLLYRAAELAVANGFDYFTVAEAETDANRRVVATPSPYSGFNDPYYRGFSPRYDFYHPRYGWRSRYQFSSAFRARRGGFYNGFGSPFYDPFYDDFDYREVTRFKAGAQVVMGHGTKPDGDIRSFNAREVLQNLGPKVVFPEEPS
ncbi:CC0125/CC1285 family lipoprotein [Robiginitomaculum antarcticum]|uniref:CC0125/CC1285 family lipoprotein n=1 Tax=Robiginitomaculum antarcticum TaxID=437507 RepID=UPI00039CFA50|nr:hypothetical protein [Robiginitomaculum antarcticum]